MRSLSHEFVLVFDVSLVLGVQVGEDVGQPLFGGNLTLVQSLLLILGDGSLLANGVLAGLSILVVGQAGSLAGFLGQGVQGIHVLLVLQGVLLLLVMGNEGGLHGVHDALDFVGVDQAGHVSVGQDGFEHLVALLELADLTVVAEKAVQGLDGALGVNHETAELSAGGQSLEGQTVHVDGLHTRDVSESLDQRDVVVGVDHEGALLLLVTLVSELALAGSEGLGVNDFLDILVSAELLEESDGLGSLLDGFETVFDDQGEFGHLADAVTAGLDEGGQGSGGQSDGHGVSSLLKVDLSVPSAVGLEGEGHATLSDHVAEGGLAGAGSAGTGNTGNSGHSAASAPGFGGVAHTSLRVDSVGLTVVLGQVGVHELDDVQTDGALEDGRHSHLLVSHLSRVVHIENREQRSRGHRF